MVICSREEMETSKDKWQGGYKRHRNLHFPSKTRTPDFRGNQFFRTSRAGRYPKGRNGFIARRNFTTRRNTEPKKISPEDAEEEERRKKLSDTANKLLDKIKTWNAESTGEKTETDQPEAEKTDTENKHKRIAHSKKTKQVKKKVSVKTKSSKSLSKSSEYDVNRATVKDFQNRIQHKLINEIMQMPKENLQNVLNDPKINPIMEVKMSRLVKENKPLIAQKLRALAEAKMTSNDSPSNPQLLVDIDKLIDPVIETDLSVLPFELIKQMENIFQVQFDYSGGEQEDVKASEGDQSFDCGNIEDLRMYECSTDEDEETENKDLESLIEDETETCQEPVEVPTSVLQPEQSKKQTKGDSSCDDTHPDSIELTETRSVEPDTQPNIEMETAKSPTPPVGLPTRTTSTQTSPNDATQLYGVPVPRESPDNRPDLLLEEVNGIHKLMSKLSERRFRIFLELLKNNSSSLSDEFTCDNFIETFSSGNVYLAESLIEFFRNKQLVGSGSCVTDDSNCQQWKPMRKKRKLTKKC